MHGAPRALFSSDPNRPVVMGGGLGGMCAASVLTRAERRAVVLEKAPVVGGLACTIRRPTLAGEFRFDIRGHRWFTKNEELNVNTDREYHEVKRLPAAVGRA